jgi:hypothetical protein
MLVFSVWQTPPKGVFFGGGGEVKEVSPAKFGIETLVAEVATKEEAEQLCERLKKQGG